MSIETLFNKNKQTESIDKDRIKILELENTKLDNDKKELRTKIKDLEDKNNQLDSQISANGDVKDKEIEKIRQVISEKDDQIKELNIEIDSLKSKIKQSDKVKDDLEFNIKNLEEKLNNSEFLVIAEKNKEVEEERKKLEKDRQLQQEKKEQESKQKEEERNKQLAEDKKKLEAVEAMKKETAEAKKKEADLKKTEDKKKEDGKKKDEEDDSDYSEDNDFQRAEKNPKQAKDKKGDSEDAKRQHSDSHKSGDAVSSQFKKELLAILKNENGVMLSHQYKKPINTTFKHTLTEFENTSKKVKKESEKFEQKQSMDILEANSEVNIEDMIEQQRDQVELGVSKIDKKYKNQLSQIESKIEVMIGNCQSNI